MAALTLALKDIDALNKIQTKLYQKKRLSSEERYILDAFLQNLPSTSDLLKEKFPLDELFEIKLFDIKEMRLHMEKWINLFNALPKNANMHLPSAGWFDAEEDPLFWKRNVIIEAEFIPSLAYSKKESFRTIGLNLKTDGTAYFVFDLLDDAKAFPELYQFNGSWKEAYLFVVKTLQQGWPQTKFPEEFEQFLKK
jgi:hypothetical protein